MYHLECRNNEIFDYIYLQDFITKLRYVINFFNNAQWVSRLRRVSTAVNGMSYRVSRKICICFFSFLSSQGQAISGFCFSHNFVFGQDPTSLHLLLRDGQHHPPVQLFRVHRRWFLPSKPGVVLRCAFTAILPSVLCFLSALRLEEIAHRCVDLCRFVVTMVYF